MPQDLPPSPSQDAPSVPASMSERLVLHVWIVAIVAALLWALLG